MSEFNPQALQGAMDAVNKKYGENTVLNLEEGGTPLSVIPVGDPLVDAALKGRSEHGGIPRYKIIEIYGAESSGKTTFALHIVAEELKLDPRAVLYIDAEHALDKGYAAHLGIDLKRVIICQPTLGKEAMTVARDLVESGQISIIVIDSWSSLEPEDDAKADEVGDKKVGGSAMLASRGLRAMAGRCGDFKATMIILNQERVNITPMGARGKVTSGGNAMKFYPSLRLEIKTHGVSQETNQFKRTLRVAKSKCQAPVFHEVDFYVGFGIGIDKIKNLMQMGLEEGVIEKSGSWYSANGERLGQGFNNASTRLCESEGMRDAICKALGVKTFTPLQPYTPKTTILTNEE